MSAAYTRTWADLAREDEERRAYLDRQIALDKAGPRRSQRCIDCDRGLSDNATTGRCEPCQHRERRRQKQASMAKYRTTAKAKELQRKQKLRANERAKAKRKADAEAAKDSHRLHIIEALTARRIETATRKLRERGIVL